MDIAHWRQAPNVIKSMFGQLLFLNETKAIDRFTICVTPILMAATIRILVANTWELKLLTLVGCFILAAITYALRKRWIKFVYLQIILLSLHMVINYNNNNYWVQKFNWTPLEAFIHSSSPILPSMCLLLMSGGIVGYSFTLINLAMMIHYANVSPHTSEEQERFAHVFYSWVIQTILGSLWIVHENKSHGLLQQALNTALDSNNAKTKFVAWLSHDLRTPLVGLYGFLDELAQDTKPTSQQKNLLEKARLCADLVNGLITNLLDFSMLEGGSFKLKPQLFNLRNSLQFQLSMLVPLASKQDIQLNYFFHDQSNSMRLKANNNSNILTSSSDAKAFELFVMGDWLRLQQILTNLVTNSIKYSNTGSEVTVTCLFSYDDDDVEQETINTNTLRQQQTQKASGSPEPMDSEDMFLRFRRPSMSRAPSDEPGFVTLDIIVEDRGIGIPAEEIPKIFSAFYQVTRASSKGSGLGLFIVREIVNVMGGTIVCTSQIGKGSKFRVQGLKFPLATQQQVIKHHQSQSSTLAEDDARKVRVLIAEDNVTNQMVLKRLLSKAHFQFEIANDGKEAVDIWNQNPKSFDLILMDLQMPRMNGIEATKEIRRIEKETLIRNPIPIIALTATTYPQELDEAILSGMQEFLIKPVNLLAMQEVVSRVLRSRSEMHVEEGEKSVKKSILKMKRTTTSENIQ